MDGYGKRVSRAWASAVLTLLAACSVGGGEEITPFWVETDIAAADLDGDGRRDVVTVAQYVSGVEAARGDMTVYRQTLAGSFPTVDRYAVGSYPWRVEVADIDGDGAPDLVVVDVVSGSATEHQVLLLLQDRDHRGVFLPPRQVAAARSIYDVAVVDVNGDGAPDLVVPAAADGGEGAQVLLQSTAQRGTFLAPQAVAFPGRSSQVGAGDLNGDGRVDLVFFAVTGFSYTTGPSGAIAILYGLPGGGFSAPVLIAPQVGLNAALIRVADADGNGAPDVIVVFTPFSVDYRSKVTVALQSGQGAFSPVDSSLAGVSGANGFVVADLNADGRPDIASTGFFPVGTPSTVRSTTHVLSPTSGGAYALAATYEMPAAMSAINAADLDGDGRTDLVLLGGDNHAFVMQQAAAAPGTFLPPRAL